MKKNDEILTMKYTQNENKPCNPAIDGANVNKDNKDKLEQLERLRSEDTPCQLMITRTIE